MGWVRVFRTLFIVLCEVVGTYGGLSAGVGNGLFGDGVDEVRVL